MKTAQKNAYIASIAVATPPYLANQAKADRFLTKHYSNKLSSRGQKIMHNILAHPSITQRNFALDDPECLVNENPGRRITRFTHWAIELSSRAVINAIKQENLSMSDISGLVVNTSTGYICPGISTYLIEKLQLSPQVRAYDLVGSGCGGAVPNLQVAELILKESDGLVVSVAVEICSCTFQMDDDLSLIVSNAIFADGAAAAVLWNKPKGFELIASSNYYATEYREDVRYSHKNGQLYNQISVNLPQIVKKAVAQVVSNLLKQQSLRIKDIDHWALHTGGDKIINSIKDEIGLEESKLLPARNVLSKHGNMSSPTVWFVMRDILNNGVKNGDLCIMIAFGAGLSAHAFLFKKSG